MTSKVKKQTNKTWTSLAQLYLPLQYVLGALQRVRMQQHYSCCPEKAYRPWGRLHKPPHERWDLGSGKKLHLTRWTGSLNEMWELWVVGKIYDSSPKRKQINKSVTTVL